jgi:hypothetical protein
VTPKGYINVGGNIVPMDTPDHRAPSLLPLVRELAELVRWYRHGRPIAGLPKYQHGQRADTLLARVEELT